MLSTTGDEPRHWLAAGQALQRLLLEGVRHGVQASYLNQPVQVAALASGIEVDFIVGNMAVAIEAKATARITSDHFRGLRHLHEDHPRARRIVVCLESRRRTTDDGIEVWPVKAFIDELPTLMPRRA